MTEGIAVHEVRHAPYGLTEDDGRREQISESPRINVMFLCVDNPNDGAEDNATLNGHAALPYKRNFEQVIVVIAPVEEEYVPQASTDKTGYTSVNTKVNNVRMPAAAVFFHDIVSHATGANNA